MKKLTLAVLAGMMSIAVAGAYAADSMKKDSMSKDAPKASSSSSSTTGGASTTTTTTTTADAPKDNGKKKSRPARATKG